MDHGKRSDAVSDGNVSDAVGILATDLPDLTFFISRWQAVTVGAIGLTIQITIT